jgi:hypothetical protein
MDDDLALDWLANEVEAPLLAAIRKALQAYLEQTEAFCSSVSFQPFFQRTEGCNRWNRWVLVHPSIRI